MDARTTFLHAARLHQTGDITRAVVLYRKALAENPGLGDAALYLGLALSTLGATQEAEQAYREAVRLLPGDPEALNGLGATCLELGRTDEAKQAHLTVLKSDPTSAEALGGLGNAFLATGETDNAITCLEKALSMAPKSSDILSNLGVALKSAGRPREAVKRFEQALHLNPGQADTLYNLGNAWQARGDMSRARHCFMAAQKSDPWSLAPKWGACFATLGMLYHTEREIENSRHAYEHALRELDEHLTLDSPDQIAEAAKMVGANQPFYLTYQGGNDRELQSRYGAMLNRIMQTAYPQFASLNFTPGKDGPVRVGIATGFMHEHSVWKIPTWGWVKELDRTRFTLFGYYTGVKQDHCTEQASALFDKLTHEPNDFNTLCQAMVDDRLDILIYPDIGMDPTCAKLAPLRLAPIQAVSLGHPMTTGLETMDYYLSSNLMEPEDGQAAYTENLVRLPNLSVYHQPLHSGKPQLTRQDFSLPEDGLLYFCPQSLYKYLPQYDHLYPLITEQVPNSRFIFLENNHADILNAQFMERLCQAFEERGIDPKEHIIMLPHQQAERYHALNCLCDVFLDSIEWSGFNTAMEAANGALPIITYPVGHMRGRHTYAVARRLGLDECIAETFDDYVALAVRMGTDHEFRQAIHQKTTANRSRLFRDREAIGGLEEFILSVTR